MLEMLESCRRMIVGSDFSRRELSDRYRLDPGGWP
jgi:hypothetical protein